jgi:aldose 1-epimerase
VISMSPPTGDQFVLTYGGHRAVVVEQGGGLREYQYMGRHVVAGYSAEEVCQDGRGTLLVPWPNGLAYGRYVFDGVEHQLPIASPERVEALHGLVRWEAWQPELVEPNRVCLSYSLLARPGFPFGLRVRVHYELAGDGLTVRLEATNIGSRPCPYAAGAHPYLQVGTPTIDDALLTVPADAWQSLAEDASVRDVSDGEYDFRASRPIGDRQLPLFTKLRRDVDGLARVHLRHPSEKRGVTVWMDPAFPYVLLWTGDALPGGRARRSLAIEPMTAPAHCFRSGVGLRILLPGETCTAQFGITPTL